MSYFKDLENSLTSLFTEDYFWIKKLKWKTIDSRYHLSTFGYLYSNRSMSTIGSASLSYINPNGGIAIHNLRIKTDGCLLAEVSTALSSNLQLTACIEDGRMEPGKPVHSFGKVGLDYEVKDMTVSADIDLINGPSLQGCALLNFYKRLNIGGEFLCNTHFDEKEKPEIIDCNVGIAFNTSELSLSVRTVDLFDIFRFGYVHHNVASLDLDLGARVDYRIRNDHQRLTLGGKWRPNENTELKGKVDSDLVISTSFSQDVLPFLRLSLCTLVDVKQEVVLDGYTFGIGLAFNFEN
mmetsp:Transcript_4596/g.7784  ORF Transcript_4596/g.7784 Transcript_4596/m.7784 type:complete len:294 (+) Transcript_4596:202-1083(+)